MIYYVIQFKVIKPRRNEKGEWVNDLVDGPIQAQCTPNSLNLSSNAKVLWQGTDPQECRRQLIRLKAEKGQS